MDENLERELRSSVSFLHRSKRTSIPEMAGYELQGSRILRKQLGCALGAILMVDPMKPITTNPLPEPFVRTRIHSRCLWQATVKAGVEDCHLENVTHTFLDDFNPVQLSTVVKRRQRGHASNRG